MKRTGAEQERAADSGQQLSRKDTLKVWPVLLTPVRGPCSGRLEGEMVRTGVGQRM